MTTVSGQSSNTSDGGRQHLGSLGKERLGAVAITFFVVSAAGPLVAMAGGIPVTMMFGNGAGIPALFIALTVLLALFAEGYTAMASRLRNAGAFYALVRAGLGARSGGAAGMVALMSYNALQIGLYGLFGAAADALVGGFIGHALPWWGYGFAAMAVIGVLGYRQIDLSIRLLGVLCAGEYLVVLLLDLAVILNGGDQGLSLRPFSGPVVLSGSPTIGLLLAFAAFIGFEATTIYSEEARDPEHSIPIATYASLLVIGVFYALSTWAMVMALGVDKVDGILHGVSGSSELLFGVADRYVGWPLVAAMRILFVTSIFAAMLAFHNAIARYVFALGRDRLLPRRFGTTHPRYSSPHAGSLAQTVLALISLLCFAVAGSDPILTVFTLPTALGTLGILLLMALTTVSIIVFFIREGGGSRRHILCALPALLGLGGIALLAAARFDLLSGAQGGLVSLLPLLLGLAALMGAAVGGRQKTCRPLGVEQRHGVPG